MSSFEAILVSPILHSSGTPDNAFSGYSMVVRHAQGGTPWTPL